MHGWIQQCLARAGLLGLVLSGLVVVASTSPAQADPCGPAGNEIACENSRPGSPPSEWEVEAGTGDERLQGFATQISVDRGERIDFKIDTDASDYDITIYRTGWYGGLGARRIAEVQPSAPLPQHQPACLVDVTTDMVDCGNWGVSASWNVPSGAVSGVYLAHLEDPATHDESHITFIVRDDASDSDIAFQTSDTTWQAYNTYGGASLYQGTHQGRATKVSYNRPFYTRSGTPGGRDFYFANEFPMVRFLERNGYDVSYLAGVDTDRRGQLLTNHDVFMSVGHDEYWSGAQRDHVEAARDAGVNLQFLSGNEVYWRTRWESSIDGNATPYRSLVTYKETAAGEKVDPSPEWTGTWRDPRFASPEDGGGLVENGLTGTAYMVNFSDLALKVPAAEGKMRLWRNTSVASQSSGGSVTLAPHTVGYESDEDLLNQLRPDGLIRLSETTGEVPEYLQDFGTQVAPGTTTHHLTQYRAPSGALVFGAGTVQWSWGLDETHDSPWDPEPADSRMQQAQVNLLADMGAQPQTLMAGLASAAASGDTSGPTVQVSTPVPGSPVPNGTELTISGTATDSGGGRVAGVEVSTDGGDSWQPATGRTSWSHTYVQHGRGPTDVLVRAIDDSANIGPTHTRTVPVACPCSVFGPEQPEVPAVNDGGAVELGLRFTPELDGFVSGVRFYKGQGNSGLHTGTLWTTSGEALAQVDFTDETATGWQQAEFDEAVPVSAGTPYVVSYTAPNGHYAGANEALAAVGRTSYPLTVDGGFGAEPAGLYADPGRIPDRSFHRAHYYVDAMFITADEAPLVATAHWPAKNAASIPTGTEIRASFSKPVTQGSPEIVVTDAEGATVPGAAAYDSTDRTVTFTPDQELSTFTVYDVTVDGEDPQGRHVSAGGSWRFRTARPTSPPGVCPCTVFDDSTLPTLIEDVDTVPVTLGMRFSPTVPGEVTGVRFYRGPRNAGPHSGALWSADGQLLAEGTFSGPWTTGWQDLSFDDPVRLTPAEEYVVSYRAPAGRYSATPNAFSTEDLSRGPLQVFRDSGAYTYGEGFPASTSFHSYLVDVVYDADPPTVELSDSAPSDGAQGVLPDAQVSAWFSKPLAAGQLIARVGGAPVPGASEVSEDGRRLTFTPDDPLPLDALVNVTLSGVVTQQGAQLPTEQWSFRTAAEDGSQTLLGNATPTTEGVNDSGTVELGMVWSPDLDGTVTQIRFFKGVGNTGQHVGSVWAMDGTRLATVTFGGETPSGWQSATLDQPLAVAAGTSYVVSYLAQQGHYSADSQFFSNARTVGDLTAPAGNNGRYLYGSGGGFPTNSWGSSNYWVDVRFVPEPPTLDVSSRVPAPGAGGVSVDAAPYAIFSDEIAAGWAMTVTADGSPVAGTATRSANGRRLTFEPDVALPTGATVQVRIKDLVSVQGATHPDVTWQFTTEAQVMQRWSLFDAVTPQYDAVNDPSSLELGTVFTSAVDGDITAIRFYKGPGNTGTHTGSIWSMSGQRLAQVTFTDESATGWQQAELATPLQVVADTSYVVSYYAPNGNYASTPLFFEQPHAVGPLSTPTSDNGRYLYGAGGGFPTGSYRSTNYFVDVVLRASGS